MKYKIVVDSSSNLDNDYIKDEEVGFEVVPLTISVVAIINLLFIIISLIF